MVAVHVPHDRSREGLDRVHCRADVLVGRDGAGAREAADEIDRLEVIGWQAGLARNVGLELGM